MTRRSGIMISLARTFDERMRALRESSQRGSALISVLIFMILLAGITVSMLAILTRQAPNVYLAERTTKTVNAAQAGLQVALGQIRSAEGAPESNGAVFGDLDKLPCKSTAFTGTVDTSASYAVTIKYYSVDPIANPTATAISCSGNKPSTQPLYALVRSVGSAAAIAGLQAAQGNRAVQAVYKFDIAHVNIPSGMIKTVAGSYCLAAAGTAANSLIYFRTGTQCTSTNATYVERRQWVYDTDYQIKLASTLGTANVMCITGPVTGTATQNAVLRKCETNANRWNQLWSWNGSYSWDGENSAITNYSSFCLAPANETSANLTDVTLRVRSNGCYTGYDFGFAPESSVGAGAASYETVQIVNFEQFGRCMDVTGENIGAAYMIAYPCKQDPAGGTQLRWNHKFYYTETTRGQAQTAAQSIFVYNLGVQTAASKYCLRSSNTNGAILVFALCPAVGALPTNMQWTRYGDTGDYGTSFRFVDGYGRCLTIDPTNVHYQGANPTPWGKLEAQNCDGADLLQKWNAEPEGAGAIFDSFKEVSP